MRKLMLCSLGVALAACGGGGGGSSPPPAAAAPPVPPPSPAGIWNGTVRVNGNLVNEVSCLVTITNQLGCLLVDPAKDVLSGAVLGTITPSGQQVTGSMTAYTAPGYTLANGSTVGTGTITASSFVERVSFTMTVTIAGSAYQISASFDPIYDRASSLATVAAVYRTFSINGVAASFSISSTGALFSQAGNGCVANGQVAVISPAVNGYTVTATLSNCGSLNGSYTGLGTSSDANGTNNVFLFGFASGQSAIVAAALK